MPRLSPRGRSVQGQYSSCSDSCAWAKNQSELRSLYYSAVHHSRGVAIELVSIRISRRPRARMPLHRRHHPAVSGQDQRTAARPHRSPCRSSRGALQGTALQREGRVIRQNGGARSGFSRSPARSPIWISPNASPPSTSQKRCSIAVSTGTTGIDLTPISTHCRASAPACPLMPRNTLS